MIKIKSSIARFKLAIQEVPAGYANEASQIIEEARIAGVYPELPPLTARDPRTKTGRPQIEADWTRPDQDAQNLKFRFVDP